MGAFSIAAATCVIHLAFACLRPASACTADDPAEATHRRLSEVQFSSHDGFPMYGRLILPNGTPPRAIVIYVQTAEGATVDQKRPLGGGRTFNYMDLYRIQLPARNIG